MVKTAQKSTRYRMTFPEQMLGEPIIYKISHDFEVIPNIMRGRITDKSAYLEVELVGTPKNTDKALKYLADHGVTVQKID